MISFSSFTLDDFLWVDRFEWSPVVQKIERALNGAQHVEPSVISQGRPITLATEILDFATFEALQTHASANQDVFTMTINGTNYDVLWLHQPKAVSGEDWEKYSDRDPEHMTDVTLTFITA